MTLKVLLSTALLVGLATLGCQRDDNTVESIPAAPVSSHAELAATPVRQAASIYDLSLGLTDQDGRAFGLDVFRGHPVVISMFYASCPYACPTLISDIQRFERKLEPEVRSQVCVLLVSFDSERDTPEQLKKLALERKVDSSRWKLARASDDQVRELAAVLGLKYRRLEGGGFNHSSAIALLDARGLIAERVEGLSQPVESLVGRVQTLVGSPGLVSRASRPRAD